METSIQINRTSPLAMASEFIKKDNNVDIDKLAKLLDIQERWEANEAKKAYVEAMAAFKASPPTIYKDRHVKNGNTEYDHASLENVTATINEALSKHGLTASWTTVQADKGVTVTCRITHVLGHSEQTSLTSGPDTSGSKNPIQALGSAVSYLQRYTLLSLAGLATEGQDDDGAAAEKQPDLPEPNEAEKKVIDEIEKEGNSFLRQDGSVSTYGQKMVNRRELMKFLFAVRKAYPSKDSKKVANWLEKNPQFSTLLSDVA
jgi:hypothetical protein